MGPFLSGSTHTFSNKAMMQYLESRKPSQSIGVELWHVVLFSIWMCLPVEVAKLCDSRVTATTEQKAGHPVGV